MPPRKKSKRGANLPSLNKAHPKHDVKHVILAEPDEDFNPEDAPGDESEDDDDDDHLDRGSPGNPELEEIRADGRARQKRRRAAAAAVEATARISSFFSPRATTPSPPPPPPPPTLQPLRGQTPPTVPPSPSPPQSFSGNEAGINADGTACSIGLEAQPAATKLAAGPAKRIGRPPGTGGGSLSRAASAASHRGQAAHAEKVAPPTRGGPA